MNQNLSQEQINQMKQLHELLGDFDMFLARFETPPRFDHEVHDQITDVMEKIEEILR